jgi:hypothetical protein
LFLEAQNKGESHDMKVAVIATMIIGLLNFIFGLPALKYIDRSQWGRRSLLIYTLPVMSIFMFIAAFGFQISDPTAKLAIVLFGIISFVIFYSPGLGPVPFTLSAECYPLYIRDLGMSFATAINWILHFVVAMTFLPMTNTRNFGNTGAIAFYAFMNLVGYFLVYL